MDEPVKILCVDDERNVLKSLNRLFVDDDYEILLADSGAEGLEILAGEKGVQLVISDYRMPEMNGVDFLKKVCEGWPDTIRIVLSGYADTASIVAAINEGQIYKFIPKPWNDDELRLNIAKALETYHLAKQNRELTRELAIFNEKLHAANEELQAANEHLEELNNNLEQLVEERTAEIHFQVLVLRRGQHILDSLPIGVLGLDNDGMIVQCNEEAGDILFAGMNSPPVGMQAEDILRPELIEIITAIESKKEDGGSFQLDGKSIRIRGKLLRKNEEKEGVILVLNSGEF